MPVPIPFLSKLPMEILDLIVSLCDSRQASSPGIALETSQGLWLDPMALPHGRSRDSAFLPLSTIDCAYINYKSGVSCL
jgi:hypothetical protein